MNLALADANSFYCSCERVFRADLDDKPIVVVGNNDGCVVSRTASIKGIIPMGAPIHQYQRQVREHGIVVFSSNYALYGEFSLRIHAIMQRYGRCEPFSCDEAFLDLAPIPPGERLRVMQDLRAAILRETHIPVTVGLAPTKVLTKLAADQGKQVPEGIYALTSEEQIDEVLRRTTLEDIWYIGPQRARRLISMGIANGLQLKYADLARIRRVLHVPVARVVCELRGITALPLQTEGRPRKEVMCARSFGHPVNELRDMQQAVASYTAAAARRLWAHHQVCGTLSVSLMTNAFRADLPQHHATCLVPLPRPTNYTPELIRAAQQATAQIFQPGMGYHRAGVLLADLQSDTLIQGNLFADDPSAKQQQLLAVIAAIEARFGKGAIYFAATGGVVPGWAMRQEHLSTTVALVVR
jgi:DNA polymerase V